MLHNKSKSHLQRLHEILKMLSKRKFNNCTYILLGSHTSHQHTLWNIVEQQWHNRVRCSICGVTNMLCMLAPDPK